MIRFGFASQIGTVGYLTFLKQTNSEWIIQLDSGGAKQIRDFKNSSDYHKCFSWDLVSESETVACLLRLTSNGLGKVGDVKPLVRDPLKIFDIIEAKNGRVDERYDYPFASGIYNQDKSKLLVWLRDDSADKLFEILKEVDPENIKNNLYRGKQISCYKRRTQIHTRSGPSLMAFYLRWCKFLITADGVIEPYPIPQWILDEMKKEEAKTEEFASRSN
jgi:hypothetical protein